MNTDYLTLIGRDFKIKTLRETINVTLCPFGELKKRSKYDRNCYFYYEKRCYVIFFYHRSPILTWSLHP